MNPPLRDVSDMNAVLEGLIDGTIDMIATDHAPHSDAEKAMGLMSGPMGVVGLECAFPILYTELVKKDVLSLEKLIKLMSTAPADRFGIESGIGHFHLRHRRRYFDKTVCVHEIPPAFLYCSNSPYN